MADKILHFRCNHYLGRNNEAIEDARLAVERQADSVVAKETLGKALYSAGQFEKALVEFHKAYRMRPNTMYEEWIGRCEETIRHFLTAIKIDRDIVEQLLEDESSKNWRDVLTVQPAIIKQDFKIDLKNSKDDLEKKKAKETKEKNERKKTGLLMGKLHDDMMFLDKISKHPALQKNLLVVEEDKKSQKDIDNVLKEIRGAALDGLSFLQVRKKFWDNEHDHLF